jgi:uncharacterized protein YndB with AHSA1/START domain
VTVDGRASAVVSADPDTVFRTLTDIDRLPSWNPVMTSVVERPEVLDAGAEWVVEFRALGQTWHSRSTVEELDIASRRFAYRSRTDDGNPSEARWTWEVTDDPGGSCVTVTWKLQPATFWRRVLLVRIRARQLTRTEVPASLDALATVTAATSASG